MKMKFFRLTVERLVFLSALAVLLSVIAAGSAMATGNVSFGKPDWWKKSETTSDEIARAAVNAVPYPLAQVGAGGFLERQNLSERLIRFSRPSKVGYVYLISFGKFVGYYVVKGKLSSVNSQMTNAQQTWEASRDQDTVVESIGDDGSFGPNEGGDRGFFFFTVNGTMVETNLEFVYSDQPLPVDVPNLGKKS